MPTSSQIFRNPAAKSSLRFWSPGAIPHFHAIGKDRWHRALGDHVIHRHERGVDGDGIVVAPAAAIRGGGRVRVHPFRDPVLGAKSLLGLAPQMGLRPAVFIDTAVRMQNFLIQENIAAIRERERLFPRGDHRLFERLHESVVHPCFGVLAFLAWLVHESDSIIYRPDFI
jgi:hypothetical protein